MQLKTLGESLTVVKTIDNVVKSCSYLRGSFNENAIISQKLAVALNGYSTEAIKSAIAQSTLTAEQIKAILSAKGLTEAEIEEVIATNALSASQTGATITTLGLGTAIKGLGASMKAFALSNPILTAIAAIGITIYGTVKAFDALTTSLDEAVEKTKSSKQELDQLTSELNDLNNELETTKDRIDELLEKANNGTISLIEEEELNNLKEQNDELQREIALKEKLAEIDAKEAADNAAYSLTYRTDDDHWDGEYNATDRIDKLQGYVDSANYYQDKISEVNKQILDIEESATDNTYKNDSAYKSLISQQQKYQEELQKTEALISSTYNDLSIEDDGLYYNGKAIDGYEDLVNRLDTVYMNVELYLNDGNIEDTTEKYIETIKSKLVESGLSEEISKIVAEGFSAEEIESIMNSDSIDWSQCLGLHDASAVIENIKDQLATISLSDSQTFDFSTYEESIDDIQSAITTLRSALDSFNKGELDSISVLDLMQQFPELAPYIDLTADGFGNLSEGLSALIAQQPDSLIQSLNELKDALSTDEERQQVDLLIDSLQRLSSYGDTGMEAYATTIGDTWNDTANVIDGVTNQFENLAKVQEAVADGLTMSATAAAELARMYPEILDHAEVTANGQITLNEEVVNSILDGDKSIIDAQIAKLEADKAVLEAKKETAIAELEIANQVGKAKGQISEEEARHQIEVLNAELNAEIDKDRQTVESYAMATQSKAQNATDFNIYAATVASDIASNMAKAAASMAESMRINSVNAQQSLSGIMQKAADVAKAIAEMATGAVSGAIDKVYSAVGGVDSGGISVSTSANSFTPTTSSYLNGDISLGEFKSGLEADIQGYIDAISNIDSQIEILKNLQLTFDNNGGIGGHGYADKVKDLEKEKDKLNDALKDKTGSGSGSDTDSAKSEFEDTVDFFERRIEALNDVLSLLKTNLDNVSGAFAKNTLVNAELGVTEEKFNNYTDALAMYTQKANEALSKLPADIAAKVKDGAVALTDFVGDGTEDVVEAIKEYESWADKVSDCKQELAGLQKEIRQLELEKFNNIMEDFNDQFDLRGNSKDLISKQMDLLKEAGELIGESFFNAQIDQSQKQLGLLEAEKAQLVNQMASAVSSGRVRCCPLLQ
nr:hypothetical protein [uncultured Acetatifactor sp.]